MDQRRLSTYEVKNTDQDEKFDPHLFKSVDEMIVEERNREIQKLEEETISLNESFDSLHSMVLSQGTDVDLAGEAIEYGSGAVAAARKELEASEKYTTRRRKILAGIAGAAMGIGAGLIGYAYYMNSESRIGNNP
jgi:hypothetical protein